MNFLIYTVAGLAVLCALNGFRLFVQLAGERAQRRAEQVWNQPQSNADKS